jgi:enamine deaminase RidA (YjgF/YER057c/UK114 family)
MSSATRHLQARPGLEVALLERRGAREFHVTIHPLPGEPLTGMFGRLRDLLRENGASVVRHSVFGARAARERTLKAAEDALGRLDWPVSWVEGDEARACNNGFADALAGMQVLAVSGAPVETVRLDGRIVGRLYSDGWARNLLLGDLVAKDPSAPRPEQSRQVFELLARALGQAGMTMKDVARTWLYLEDLLSWYRPFNEVRAIFFQEQGLLRGRIPASTGIHGRNPAGSAVLAGAWAVQALDPAFAMRELPSPLQCPAPKYGSCFSRAMELATPDLTRVFVSGTASIAPDGCSARPNDSRGQIDLTMEVIEAILAQRGLGFEDVTRAITYFKRIGDEKDFRDWCAERRLTAFPTVSMQTDVCRDELLFEIELDAAAVPSRAGV